MFAVLHLLSLAFLQSCRQDSIGSMIAICLSEAGGNKSQLETALQHYPAGSESHSAMEYLVANMTWHISQERPHNSAPQQTNDASSISSSYLVNNVDKAIAIWKGSPWVGEVDFNTFCECILPYKIDQEPIVEWRDSLAARYGHLIAGVESMEEAFTLVLYYLREHFTVKDNSYPYEADILQLDSMQGGDCRERALHTTYVMRALGIPAVLEYIPVWANQGENAHYWVSLSLPGKRVFTIGRDSINYIDGTYEPFKYNYDRNSFPYCVDSLKRIAKVYRKTFHVAHSPLEEPLEEYPPYLQDVYSMEVTSKYHHLTNNNVLELDTPSGERLYVCTFKQQDGWTPVGVAKRLDGNHVDLGPLIHDNVVVVASFKEGVVIPMSSPYVIRRGFPPRRLLPGMKNLTSAVLYRKYYVSSRWTNRWGDMIGAVTEEAADEGFTKNVFVHHRFTQMPTEESNVMFAKKLQGRFLRFLPASGKYPVPAEIELLDKNGNAIPTAKYRVFAIGENLTGDTLVTRSFQDHDPKTTFFKQFPYWIGFELMECKNDVAGIRYLLWNDMNRITPGHEYELLYFDREWKSLGLKTAEENMLWYENVPENALLLLRDYTDGREERIFIYENGRQKWW